MKKITITLSNKAEQYFNEVMYSLPKHNDGTGCCTQSQAINHILESNADFENIMEEDILTFLYSKQE